MAANVVVLTEAEWDVFSGVTSRLDEGGIVVSPEAARKFKEVTGHDVPDGDLVEYAFDDADVYVDFLEPDRMDGYAASAIKEHLGIE